MPFFGRASQGQTQVILSDDESMVRIIRPGGAAFIVPQASDFTIPRPVVPTWSYSPTGTTYWVAKSGSDGNPGTSVLPFLTIQKYLDVAVAGDCGYVLPGTYLETLTVKAAGTSGHPIILSCAPVAQGGGLGTVIIQRPQADVAADYATWLSLGVGNYNMHSGIDVSSGTAKSYITLNGLLFLGDKGTAWEPVGEFTGDNGIRSGSGFNWTITNCVICNQHGNGCNPPYAQNDVIQGNVVFDCGTYGTDQGFYLQGDSGTVDGNIIFNVPGDGVALYDGTAAMSGWTLTNNLVFGCFANLLTQSHNVVVRNNTCTYARTGFGIAYYGESWWGAGDHNIAALNRYGENADHYGGGTSITGVSSGANPTITTSFYHGFSAGDSVTISGVLGATGVNGTWTVATTPTTRTFTITTSAPGTYTSAGSVKLTSASTTLDYNCVHDNETSNYAGLASASLPGAHDTTSNPLFAGPAIYNVDTGDYISGSGNFTIAANSPAAGMGCYACAAVDLSAAYNRQGIQPDQTSYATGGIGINTPFFTLSKPLLQNVLVWNGCNFTIAATGASNVVKCTGTQIDPLAISISSGSNVWSKLCMLALSAEGLWSSTFTVTYGDFSTDDFVLSIPDWTARPPAGSNVAFTMQHVNQGNGIPRKLTSRIYGFEMTLQAKTVLTLTLPSNASIFVIALAYK